HSGALSERPGLVAGTAKGRRFRGDWSVGTRRSGISPGDRGYLLRVRDHRGIVAEAEFTSEVWEGIHWEDDGLAKSQQRPAYYAAVDWVPVVCPDARLPVDVLKRRIPSVVWDRIQGSGNRLNPHAASRLERLWTEHVADVDGGRLYPDEIDVIETYQEGIARV